MRLDPTAASLASRIGMHLRESVGSGHPPQIILDLDGTLFDNVPRTKRILLDQARALFGPESELVETIGSMAEETFEYNPVDTLRKHGVQDEATLQKLHDAWAGQFFASTYLTHDAPLAGAVDAARAWWSAGAELNYLTGRHVPEMFLGTCRSLHDAGFPVGTLRTQILMKPAADLDDVAFKVDVIPAIRLKGPLLLVVDNDPRVLNPLRDAAPEAIFVMVHTLHPKDAPPLAKGIEVVKDFRELME